MQKLHVCTVKQKNCKVTKIIVKTGMPRSSYVTITNLVIIQSKRIKFNILCVDMEQSQTHHIKQGIL